MCLVECGSLQAWKASLNCAYKRSTAATGDCRPALPQPTSTRSMLAAPWLLCQAERVATIDPVLVGKSFLFK